MSADFDDIISGTGCAGCECDRCLDKFFVWQDETDEENENREIRERAADHLSVHNFGKTLNAEEHKDSYLLLSLLITELMRMSSYARSAQIVAQTIMSEIWPEDLP